jgi:hypothetical protein
MNKLFNVMAIFFVMTAGNLCAMDAGREGIITPEHEEDMARRAMEQQLPQARLRIHRQGIERRRAERQLFQNNPQMNPAGQGNAARRLDYQ